MKVIGNGRTFRIYDDGMQTYEQLPAATYAVRFSMMQGFWLEKKDDMRVGEDKIYGVHNSKVDKVMRGFSLSERNFGVILSGVKGIGKSLFARLLSNKAIEAGTPVVIVDENIEGISDFIESIQQPVMVLFDEFEKVFNKKEHQEMLLSMFDGTSNGRKLYVITCNNLHDLSDYLVNRPGRFHYHFQFDYPTDKEVHEYMMDKLNPEVRGAIDDVVAFAGRASLNYDCLRAIAFELNSGVPFAEAIADLNIMHIERERYNLTAYFKNGITAMAKNVALDLFGDREQEVYIRTKSGEIGYIEFSTDAVQYSLQTAGYEIPGADVELNLYSGDDDEKDEDLRPYALDARNAERAGLEKLVIRVIRKSVNTHYMV